MPNTETLTEGHVKRFKDALTKLRRSRISRTWKGGFYSFEVTWSKRNGFHLHCHLLIEARFIDQIELAKRWREALGVPMAIVKVKDVRDKSYLAEVTKYIGKGNETAAMPGLAIAQLIDSFEGVKTFGVFGELYKQRAAWKKYTEAYSEKSIACPCGCTRYLYLSEQEFLWHCIEKERSPPEVPVPFPQLELNYR